MTDAQLAVCALIAGACLVAVLIGFCLWMKFSDPGSHDEYEITYLDEAAGNVIDHHPPNDASDK